MQRTGTVDYQITGRKQQPSGQGLLVPLQVRVKEQVTTITVPAWKQQATGGDWRSPYFPVGLHVIPFWPQVLKKEVELQVCRPTITAVRNRYRTIIQAVVANLVTLLVVAPEIGYYHTGPGAIRRAFVGSIFGGRVDGAHDGHLPGTVIERFLIN